MSTYKFRKAAVGDLNRIAEIYSNILDLEEAGKATTGWVRNIYPSRETALEGINADEMFVLEDEDTIVAAARINQEQVPEYANASWEHTDAPDDKVMVLHTLVVDPTLSDKGYGSAFVRFYEDYAAKHVRIYAWTPTSVMLLPDGCMPIWVTEKPESSPARLTAFAAFIWFAWKKQSYNTLALMCPLSSRQ